MSFDVEKMHKLPPGARFFDINDLWYFSNRWVVRFLYPLPVTANQITVLSLVLGLAAAGFYLVETPDALIVAAIFFYGKIYFDNVDGNLARARGEVSRIGRFLDSLIDFVVTTLVYAAVTFRLVREAGDVSLWILGLAALLSCFVQCSYFVYYLVNYTDTFGSYEKNRADESITKNDRTEHGPIALFLQGLHQGV